MTSLDIIIVNWNTGRQLRDCLESIVATDRSGFEIAHVIVVDNASSDHSADGLEGVHLPLTVIRNKENRGFGAACNQGALGSQANYLLFLNPDTRLFKESLCRPLLFMEGENSQDVGICGVQLVDENERFSTSCARFPCPIIFLGAAMGLNNVFPELFPKHLMPAKECTSSRCVDQVIGAFFLVRHDLFRLLHGFDERFFVYFEEVDFSLRAKKSGYASYYLADARAFHKGGGCSNTIQGTRLFYSLRSRIQYGLKHFSVGENVALLFITFVLESVSRVFVALIRRSYPIFQKTVLGYLKLIGYLLKAVCNGISR